LNHVKVESFLIKKAKGPINYELDLLKDAKVFLVFYISLLELVDSTTPLQDTFYFHPQKEKQYEVEKILRQEGQKYLIKWKEYSILENTWEPEKNLNRYWDLLRKFHQS